MMARERSAETSVLATVAAPRRMLVKHRPSVTLLDSGDLLIPVHREPGWDVVLITIDSAHYVEWFAEWQQAQGPRGVNLEAFMSFLLPPFSNLFALSRLLRDEVGPGLAMLLAGWIGAAVWVWVLATFVGVRLLGA